MKYCHYICTTFIERLPRGFPLWGNVKGVSLWGIATAGNWLFGGMDNWINKGMSFKQSFSTANNPIVFSGNYHPGSNSLSNTQASAHRLVGAMANAERGVHSNIAGFSGMGRYGDGPLFTSTPFDQFVGESPLAYGVASARMGYTIDMQRIAESPDATISEFTAYGPIPLKPLNGYILEPGGPSTTTANQDKRIPSGIYSVNPRYSKKFSNHYIISNSLVSQDRLILIHSGYSHEHTSGCLLPGRSYSLVNGNYVVSNSKITFNSLRLFLRSNSATLNIYDIYAAPPTPFLIFRNW